MFLYVTRHLSNNFCKPADSKGQSTTVTIGVSFNFTMKWVGFEISALLCWRERNYARILEAVSVYWNSVAARTLELPMPCKNNAGNRMHTGLSRYCAVNEFLARFLSVVMPVSWIQCKQELLASNKNTKINVSHHETEKCRTVVSRQNLEFWSRMNQITVVLRSRVTTRTGSTHSWVQKLSFL